MRTEVPNYEPDTQREDEVARQQRWDDFAQSVRAAHLGVEWGDVLARVADAMDTLYRPTPTQFEQRCRDFAETEDWSGVMSVIAQTMRERERFHRECFDRR